MKSSFNTSIIALAAMCILSAAAQAEGDSTSVQSHPNVPTISNETWAILEASDAYRNLPKAHSIYVSFEAVVEKEKIGKGWGDLASLAVSANELNEQRKKLGLKVDHDLSYIGGDKKVGAITVAEEIASKKSRPLGEKCLQMIPPKPLDTTITYSCAPMLQLGMAKYPEGTPSFTSYKYLEIKGSLFPMRVGAELSVTQVISIGSNSSYDSRVTTECKVTNKGNAKELDSKLTGNAWTVKCASSKLDNKTGKPVPTMSMDNYYLADKGVFLSQIGVVDAKNGKFVIPTPGSKIIEGIANGDYGMTITRTYKSYDWSVDN